MLEWFEVLTKEMTGDGVAVKYRFQLLLENSGLRSWVGPDSGEERDKSRIKSFWIILLPDLFLYNAAI